MPVLDKGGKNRKKAKQKPASPNRPESEGQDHEHVKDPDIASPSDDPTGGEESRKQGEQALPHTNLWYYHGFSTPNQHFAFNRVDAERAFGIYNFYGGKQGWAQGHEIVEYPAWLRPMTKNMANGETAISSPADIASQYPSQYKSTPPSGKWSREEKEKAVVEYLRLNYIKCCNTSRVAMLMDQATGQLFPLTASEVRKRVKAYFLETRKVSISNGVLDSALDVFTDVNTRESFVSPVVGRAGFITDTEERLIYTGNGFYGFAFQSSSFQFIHNYPHIVPQYSAPLKNTGWFNNQCNYSLDELKKVFNSALFPNECDLLVIAWMILVWMPDKKQVMLELLGPPRESQVVAQRWLKALLDPSRNSIAQSPPSSKAKFEAYAQRDFLLSFERLDALTLQQQRLFLAILQGQQVRWNWPGAKRTDIEIHVQCPLLVSSIESLVTHTPLAERTLSVDITPASHSASRPWPTAALISGTPMQVHSLLIVLGYVHMYLPTYHSERDIYREGPLSDLCAIGELVATFMGRPVEEFWEQLGASRRAHQQYALEENHIAKAVIEHLKDNGNSPIENTVHEWLEWLAEYRPEGSTADEWPTTPRALSAQFKLSMELLERHGIQLKPLGKRGSYGYWRAEVMADKMEDTTP